MRRLVPRDPVIGCALALGAFELALQSFRVRTWEEAGDRGLIIAALAAALALVTWRQAGAPVPAAGARGRSVLRALVAAALIWDAAIGVIAVRHTALTGDIRMDQGQAIYKGALALRRGVDPYGRDQLFDPYAYIDRAPLRARLGVGPKSPGADVWAYWGSGDPKLKDELLPRAPPGASADAVRETEILGYKYGPLPLVAAAVLAPLLGPVAVTGANVALVLALYGVCWLILRARGLEPALAALALAAILVDHFPSWYYMHFSNSDAWPMLCSALALFAAMTGRTNLLGVALGLALASKLFPSLLFVPLLLLVRSCRAALVTAVVAGALVAPFALWDTRGFLNNYVLWPLYMTADNTAWVQRVPPELAFAARAALAAFIAFLWLRLLLGRETRPFLALALMAMAATAAGPHVHNNYVPWFSLWAAIAVAEAFSARIAGSPLAVANAAGALPPWRFYTSAP